MIFEKIAPKTWQDNGGQGMISHNETTRCIEVRQTREVHEEIEDLLIKLRRMARHPRQP